MNGFLSVSCFSGGGFPLIVIVRSLVYMERLCSLYQRKDQRISPWIPDRSGSSQKPLSPWIVSVDIFNTCRSNSIISNSPMLGSCSPQRGKSSTIWPQPKSNTAHPYSLISTSSSISPGLNFQSSPLWASRSTGCKIRMVTPRFPIPIIYLYL